MPKALQTAVATDEILFELQRFELIDSQLRVVGRWFGVRGRRFVRPTLTPLSGRDTTRVLADLEHKPWAAEDGERWEASFPWDRNGAGARFELSVSPDIVIQLPSPRSKLTLPRRFAALPREPSFATVWRQPRPDQAQGPDPSTGSGVEVAPVPAEPEFDPIAELDATREQLAGLEQQLEASREELATAIAAREAATAQAEAAVTERNRLRSENECLVAEREQLLAAQAALDATQSELSAAGAELTAAHAELQNAFDQLTAERDQLAAELAAAERSIGELRSEVEQADAAAREAIRARDEAITAHGAAMVMRRASRTAPYYAREHSAWRTALAVLVLVGVIFTILIVAHVL